MSLPFLSRLKRVFRRKSPSPSPMRSLRPSPMRSPSPSPSPMRSPSPSPININVIQGLLNTNKYGRVNKRIGAPSVNGAIFSLTNSKYVVKVVPNSKNANKEILAQKHMAGLNIAPKIYNNKTVNVNPNNINGLFKNENPSKVRIFVMNRIGSNTNRYMGIANYKREYRGKFSYNHFKNLISKVNLLHNFGYTHANLHEDNIALVVDPTGKIKKIYIIDYGRSKQIRITRSKKGEAAATRGLFKPMPRIMTRSLAKKKEGLFRKMKTHQHMGVAVKQTPRGSYVRSNYNMLKKMFPNHFRRYMKEKI